MSRSEANRVTLALIDHAVKAGAYRSAVRQYPAGADVFEAAADKRSAEVAALAAQLPRLLDGDPA